MSAGVLGTNSYLRWSLSEIGHAGYGIFPGFLNGLDPFAWWPRVQLPSVAALILRVVGMDHTWLAVFV
jgi:hypothetical protein